MMNGETIVQAVSIPKHQNLVASELVLASAVRKGQLEKLATFSGSPFAAGMLRSMVKVTPVDKAADALELRCTGPVAADLPVILEQIVAAYMSVIEEDTVAAGKDSVMLIERLQERLVDDQQIAQKRYLELVAKLNLTAENEKRPMGESICRRYHPRQNGSRKEPTRSS